MAANKNRVPRRLVHEKSSYLLQHVYNPLDGFPWSNEALTRQKPKISPSSYSSYIPPAIMSLTAIYNCYKPIKDITLAE